MQAWRLSFHWPHTLKLLSRHQPFLVCNASSQMTIGAINEGEREVEWQRRDQYREEAQQHEEWEHNHCVRDWQNQEYCRR